MSLNSYVKNELIDEKTRELAKRARSGDQTARREMIELHEGLAKYVAGQFQSGDDPDDILQNAYWGLCRAVDKYEPDRDNTFATYATWWIRNQILSGMRDRAIVHIPQTNRTVANMARRFMDKYRQIFKREPTAEEIAKAVRKKAEDVPGILGTLVTKSDNASVTLDDPINANRDYSYEGSDAIEYHVGRAIARRVLKNSAVLFILTERERDVIAARFGLDGTSDLTASELGEKYHCTRSNINALATKALLKLRNFITKSNQEKERQRT